jgi:hypothetical protein
MKGGLVKPDEQPNPFKEADQ